MSELEHQPGDEHGESEITSAELADACKEVFEQEQLDQIASLPTGEAFMYISFLLLAEDIDPDEFFQEKGILPNQNPI